MAEQIEERCRQVPGQLSADSGFHKNERIEAVTARGVDIYIPDSNMAHELNGGRADEQSFITSPRTNCAPVGGSHTDSARPIFNSGQGNFGARRATVSTRF